LGALGYVASAALVDYAGTGYGGYYLGYPDEGKPKELIKGKSVENNADIFAAFRRLAAIERQLGHQAEADKWRNEPISLVIS
jgi:hypothetical protein